MSKNKFRFPLKRVNSKNESVDFICFTDGACYPFNPGGTMGIGAIIKDAKTNEVLNTVSKTIPKSESNSNNVAEYLALGSAIDLIYIGRLEMCTILIKADSMLMVKQMTGAWRIKEGKYAKVALECENQIQYLEKSRGIKFFFKWIPREENTEADYLSNPEGK